LPSDDLPLTPPDRWPHIATLLANGGHITVGCIPPINGAAIAADEHSLLATLVRRPGESFDDLLQRLDQAIGRALNEGIQTNEIEGGQFMLAAPKKKQK
jgi:hypothetical protein